MHQTGYVKLDEPFAGLFTQGMVCHETYKDHNGNWLSPEEVEKRDGKAFLNGTGDRSRGRLVGEDVEVEEERRRADGHDRYFRRGHDPLVHAVGHAARTRRRLDRIDGAEGCWRFVQRIRRLVTEAENLPPPGTAVGDADGAALELRQATHRAIAAVTDDLANAALQPRGGADLFAGQCYSGGRHCIRRRASRSAGDLVLLIGPMMPHLAESCWEALGHKAMIVETPWPSFIEALTRSETVTIAVQVNGKRRDEVTVAVNADEETVETGRSGA